MILQKLHNKYLIYHAPYMANCNYEMSNIEEW